MSLFIKICGITRLKDAEVAVDSGADALGFMFYRLSKRFIEPAAARLVVDHLPSHVARVGVFVNADATEVRDAIAVSGIDTVQFHGGESPEFCAAFRSQRVWKAFRMEGPGSLSVIRRYPEVDGWLLDSHVAGNHGGTGRSFDWSLAIAAKELGRPVILAGGLNPENVADAVTRVRPFGVDVSSGVESAPGRKDAGKMAAFIRNARQSSR